MVKRFRHYWRRARHFMLHRVLHADDPPHALALGVAIGVFVTFMPAVGVQMVLVVFLAWLLRANKAVGLPIVWITNPATMVPIYYGCYVVGRSLLGQQAKDAHWWRELAHPPQGWWPTITFFWERLIQVAGPLTLGCLTVSLVLAYPSYYIAYHIVSKYRMRRWGQLVPPSHFDRNQIDAAQKQSAESQGPFEQPERLAS